MNRAKTVTIVCWVISAVALLGLVVWFLLGSVFGTAIGFDFGGETFEPLETQRVSVSGIDAIEIEWVAGAVYVGTHSGDEILVTEFTRRNLREDQHMLIHTDGGTLAIQFSARRSIQGGNMPAKQLEVLIPEAISQDFAEIQVSTVSGRVVVGDVHAGVMTISTTSGRIVMNNVAAQTIHASTTSGRIEVLGAEAEEMSLRTVSGRIETGNVETQVLRTHTTSGRHELSGSFGDVNARSTSGRIEIVSLIVPDNIVADATSGRVEVTVPQGDVVSVWYSTSSGRFRSEIPVVTSGSADAQFRLSTSSGRISIFALS